MKVIAGNSEKQKITGSGSSRFGAVISARALWSSVESHMLEIDALEMARRLKREGAKSGELQISLMWNTTDDLDMLLVMSLSHQTQMRRDTLERKSRRW